MEGDRLPSLRGASGKRITPGRALRSATYRSASFVSPRGVVLTNHHCSRENTGKVMRPGENFDSTGFYAATEAEERRVPGLFVEQLLAIADVSGAVDSASRAGV